MFTLTYADTEQAVPDVPDPIRHMQTARSHALAAAVRDNRDVLILVNERARVRITPNGRSVPPDGVEVAERSQCVKHEGKVCFCIVCRDERKAAR